MRVRPWLGLSVLALACDEVAQSASQPLDPMLGGETSVIDTSRDAFAQPVANMDASHRDPFFLGNSLFNRSWVTAPASTDGLDGLGPTYNATSCAACHFKDGRGAPPEKESEPFLGILVRLSVPGDDGHGGPLGDPRYGGQLNPTGILGVPGEGQATLRYTERRGTFEDGTPYTLLEPKIELSELAYGPLDPQVLLSVRVAPQMIGLGLLEAVSEADLLSREDIDDRDGDGISGRANRVWDAQRKRSTLGRFGWKANQPNLAQQTAGAFLGDMGITSPLFSEQSCTDAQVECQAATTGGTPEIDARKLEAVVSYSHLLAVPTQRDADLDEVRRGARLFDAAGCASCHVPTLQTSTLDGFPELSNQTIHPYTDLLLHDLGPELSDERPDYLASGAEWRTPPLWGIGLFHTVNGHTRYLHDGRARDLNEALLWHGGEAETSRDAYIAMSKDERAALLRFLGSL